MMILTGYTSIDLCMEVGKARNYCNTTASNSIRNTARHGALPVRYRVLFALLKPKACSALGADGKLKWTEAQFSNLNTPVPHNDNKW